MAVPCTRRTARSGKRNIIYKALLKRKRGGLRSQNRPPVNLRPPLIPPIPIGDANIVHVGLLHGGHAGPSPITIVSDWEAGLRR